MYDVHGRDEPLARHTMQSNKRQHFLWTAIPIFVLMLRNGSYNVFYGRQILELNKDELAGAVVTNRCVIRVFNNSEFIAWENCAGNG